MRKSNGNNKHPLFSRWSNMMTRCHSPESADYRGWGGRGITVCDRWHYFANYIEDLKEVPFEGAQLDRIDNNKGYSPENCRWVSKKENLRNTRRARLITYKNETLGMSTWAERFGVNPGWLMWRLNKGLSMEEIEQIVEQQKGNSHEKPRV